MAEPGDHGAAPSGGHGRLRASRADREQVIEALKDAFAQDRLDKDEFDARVGQAFVSRTYAELAAVTADLPAAPVAAPPPVARPARSRVRSPQYEGYKAAVGAFAAYSACLLAGLEIVTPDGNPVMVLVAWVVFTAFCALVLGALLLLHSRLDKRAARPLPPGQGPGVPGLACQRPSQLGPAGVLPGARPDQTRAGLRTHRPGRDPRHPSGRGSRAPCGVRPAPGAA